MGSEPSWESGESSTPSSETSVVAPDKYQEGRYLAGKPHEFRKRDLFRLPFSKKNQQRAFSTPLEGDRLEKFKESFDASCSLLAQKVVNSIEQKEETPLNIYKCSKKASRGKLKVPDSESDNCRSLTEQDKQVELVVDIKPGNPKYKSYLNAMASKFAYENKAIIKQIVEHHWKMEFIDMDIDFWNDYLDEASTQGFMFHDQRANMIVVAFRGTERFNASDWRTNVDISSFKNREMGSVHGGFMKALGLIMEHGWPFELPENKRDKNLAYYSIRAELKKRLHANKEAKFTITGHSQGGALAILFPAILALHRENTLLERLEGVYTFGQPKVGDSTFKIFMEKNLEEYQIEYLRFVCGKDLVPHLPLSIRKNSRFKHFGTCLHFDHCYQDEIRDEVLQNEDNQLDELIKGLSNGLSEHEGSFYRDKIERLKRKLLNKFRAHLPSLRDHRPCCYVNATVFGTCNDRSI